MRETPNGKRLAIGADEPSDEAIAHLIFAEGGNPNPSAELLGSLSEGAIARRREKLTADAAAEVEAKRAASPEGRIAAARADREEREKRRELVALAAEQVGWTEADVAELGEDAVLREAGFQETRFEDIGDDLEAQEKWLNAHPDEARAMFAEAEFKQLAARWPGLDSTERAHAAAHFPGASSIAEVEAELVKRGHGDSFTPIAGQPAAEAVFERESEVAKGGDSA